MSVIYIFQMKEKNQLVLDNFSYVSKDVMQIFLVNQTCLPWKSGRGSETLTPFALMENM